MKLDFSRVLLINIAIRLFMTINSSETSVEVSVLKKLKRFKRHLMREEEADCGCKIVYSYYEGPKELKRKEYKKRWANVPPLPKPEIKVEPVTCEPADGGAFLAEIRKLFPAPDQKAKPNITSSTNTTDTETPDGSSSSSSTTTVSQSSSTTVVSSGPPSGKYTGQLFTMAKAFKDRIVAHKLRKSKLPKSTKRKRSRREIDRLEKLKAKEIILNKGRKECYHRIRQYLQESYIIPYKGTKCHLIGRSLYTCLNI